MQLSQEIFIYTIFGTTIKEDVEELPYGDDFTFLKMGNIDDRYLEDLDDLIGTQVSLSEGDGVPSLAMVRRRKLNHKYNL